MKSFFYLLKREVWEHPSIYVAPLIVGGIVALLAIPGGLIEIARHSALDEIAKASKIAPDGAFAMFSGAAGSSLSFLFGSVMAFVLFFYLLDSLYSERKERTIYFFKSMPVTDTETVLSKLVTAVITIPAATILLILATMLLLMVEASGIMLIAGAEGWGSIWSPGPFIRNVLTIIYGFAAQSLWWLPLIGWFLFASAWAKRSPFIWSILPLIGVIIAEGVLLRSANFAEMLGERMIGALPLSFRHDDIDFGINIDEDNFEFKAADISQLIDPTPLLTSPGLWIGVVVAAGFVYGAIWLRRYRDQS